MTKKPETVVYSNGRIVDGQRHIPNGHLVTEGAAIVAVGVGRSQARHVIRRRSPCRSGRPHPVARLYRLPRPPHHAGGSRADADRLADGPDGRAHARLHQRPQDTARRRDDRAGLRRAASDRLRAAPRGGRRTVPHTTAAAERPRIVHDRRAWMASARPGGRRPRPGQACGARANQGRGRQRQAHCQRRNPDPRAPTSAIRNSPWRRCRPR